MYGEILTSMESGSKDSKNTKERNSQKVGEMRGSFLLLFFFAFFIIITYYHQRHYYCYYYYYDCHAEKLKREVYKIETKWRGGNRNETTKRI